MVIEEQNEDNDETARNVYGRNLITRETSDGVVVYAYNGHGDVVAICNLDGDTLVVYEYDEFGNVTSETVVDEGYANFDNPYRYAGYEYLEQIGIYDLNARYYNPEIARFLSPDPYYNLGNRVIGLYEINVPNAWSIIQANNVYAYCGNNPVLFKDTAGTLFDFIVDIAGAVWSVADFIKNPSLINAGFLVWDVAAIVLPFVPGSYVGKGGRFIVKAGTKADDVVDTLKALKTADRIDAIKDGAVVMSYKNLKKVSAGTGLEAHHLIEKRFMGKLGIENSDDILSIAIDKDTHQAITNSFRKKIGYNGDKLVDVTTSSATPQKIWNTLCEVYRENGMEDLLPELKDFLLENSKTVNEIVDWGGVK